MVDSPILLDRIVNGAKRENHAPPMRSDKSSRVGIFGGLMLVAVFCLVACGFAVNLSMPWESDQTAKAAQILEIANQRDYLLSESLTDYYRLRLFPLYYSVSGLMYSLVGGDIFAFMNLSSVFVGVLAGVALATALYNGFGISPLWTGLTLVAMPLFVITYSYGNEAAWSIAFYFLSLALVSSPWRGWHYAGGAAVAASLFCRPDIVLLAPHWWAWTKLVCKYPCDETWIKRVLRPTVAFLVTAFGLWLLFGRRIPETVTSFEFGFNLKLIAAYLSYPFNLSLVALAAIGWLMLMRRNAWYAWAHLLLLLPFLFYAGNLPSPKYLICLVMFYGMPAAYLLQEVSGRFRTAMIAMLAVWLFVGVSVFGVFGPKKASLWYVPTADGPCPIGGYLHFYARARAGKYQHKQVEQIAEIRDFIEFAKSAEDRYWLAGHYPNHAYSLIKARGMLGTPAQHTRIERILNAPGSQGQVQPNDGSRTLLLRSGYSDLASIQPDLAERIRTWLGRGQLQAHGPRASEALPTVIEVGDHLAEGTNSVLGERILFMINHYQSHMIFEESEFISDYRATSCLPTDGAGKVSAGNPIYGDEDYTIFEMPVEGAKVFSCPWPARYYQYKSPKPRRRGSLEQ